MDSTDFIQLCKEKFGYLKENYGFKVIEENHKLSQLYIIFGKKNLKIKVNYDSIKPSMFPIKIDLILGVSLLEKILRKKNICELDDLMIYKKCSTKVYDYLDYNNVESFYNKMTDEDIQVYEEKYSKDEEVVILVDKYAYLLREFGSDIFNSDLNLLIEVIKMREKYDKKYHCVFNETDKIKQ